MPADEWIGVDDIATEMKYTKRQAWEYVRSIGLASANARKMDLARFTRAQFEEARLRALSPLAARVRTGAVATAIKETRPKRAESNPAATAASEIAKIKRSLNRTKVSSGS